MSVIQLKNTSWVIPGPTNIGIVEAGNGVYLIDSGNDKDAGRKLLKILNEKGWNLKGIINTHSNADHIGGNNYLQGMTNCEIWATIGEAAFINTPILEGSFLWGGYPYKELRTKFFEAKPSRVTKIIGQNESTAEMEFIPLPGHFFDMVGIITNDGVFYMGDSLFGEKILEKYKIPYIYDVKEFRNSLEKIKTIQAEYYVPSHGEILTKIDLLAETNMQKVNAIEEKMLKIMGNGKVFEDILKELCGEYGIALDYGQYVLVGNTLRSFLAYLYNGGKAKYEFDNNKMYWSAIK